MPQQTNRIPSGFLDLIGAETGGKTPPYYDDVLKPGVDLTELFRGQTLSADKFTWVVTAAGNNHLMTVPENEAWLLRHVSVSEPMGTTVMLSSYQVGIWNAARQEYGNAFSAFWSSKVLQVQINGQVAHDAFHLASPMLLLPGTTIYWQCRERDAGAGRNVTIAAGFNLLRAGAR